MNAVHRFALLSMIWLWVACTTPLRPGNFEVEDGRIPRFSLSSPVAIRGIYDYAGDRKFLLTGGTNVLVSYDEFTTALATRTAELLRSRGVEVEPAAEKTVEIQVVRVSVLQRPTMTCVIDFNLRIGDSTVRGFQSRATRFLYPSACAEAVSEAVIAILKNDSVIDFLQ